MKKTILSSIVAVAFTSLFLFSHTVNADELSNNLNEIPTESELSEEIELLDFDIENDMYKEVTFEEDDGTMATVSLSRVVSSPGEVTTFALTPGRAYQYRYNGLLNSYSFFIHVTGNPLKIYRLYGLQYTWKDGRVKSTSLKKFDNNHAQAQLIIDTPWGGTKTETANVKLNATGRGGGWHILVTRNNSSSGVKLSD